MIKHIEIDDVKLQKNKTKGNNLWWKSKSENLRNIKLQI